MQRLTTASALIVAQALAVEYNLAVKQSELYDAKVEYEVFGDCVGLSPIVFGEPGPFVQSDMQYAQSFVDEIREYANENGLYAKVGVGSLEPRLAAAIGTRFFVAEQEEGGQKTAQMVASELHVERGTFMEAWVNERISQDSEADDLFNSIHPQTHGYHFKGMFNEDEVV